MQWIAGAANSSLLIVTGLLQIPEVSTLIVGDPFCYRRVSQFGRLAIPPVCRKIKQHGKQVGIMTSVYATDSQLREDMNLLTYLQAEQLIDLVVIHDIGTLVECRARKIEAAILWDRYGFGRDFRLNEKALEVLKELGVTLVEIQHRAHCVLCQESGLESCCTVLGPDIATFGRVCYTEYLAKSVCQGRDCLERNPQVVLRSEETNNCFIPDGYRLLRSDAMIQPSPETITAINPDTALAWVYQPEQLRAAIFAHKSLTQQSVAADETLLGEE